MCTRMRYQRYKQKPPSELPRPKQIYLDALKATDSLEKIFHKLTQY